MPEHVLEWDDFTGGYFVGQGATRQQKNTYRGTNVVVDANEGYLVALPPWVQLTYDSGSPTDPSTEGHVGLYTDGENAWKVHQVAVGNNLNLVKYADTGNPSHVDVTNFPVADVDYLTDTEAWNSRYLFASYKPVVGPNNLARFDMQTDTWATYTTPEPLRMIRRYGQVLIGASLDVPYRLWYSAAYDPTTWDPLDFEPIGDAGSISALVSQGDALYVGKPDGWWVVTGILGVSASIRQAATGFPGPNGTVTDLGPRFGWLSNAEAGPHGVLFTSTQLPVTASLMNGTIVHPVNYASPDLTAPDPNETGTWLVYPISPGLFAFTSRGFSRTEETDDGTRTIAWVLDARSNTPRWYKVSIPYMSGYYTQGIVSRYLPDMVNGGLIWIAVGTDLHQMRLPPLLDMIGSGEPGYVYLAEQRRTHPFIVEVLYVEIVWLATAAATPHISAAVEMRGWPDLTSPGRHASSSLAADVPLTPTAPPSSLFHDDRYIYGTFEFSPNAPAGTGVVPILSFDDCKVRRVWMTVRDAGRS